MNQTSIGIDKTLAVNLYAIATRVVMIAETSSTILRSTATDRQQESLASMAINSVLIAQEPLGKAGRQLFRMAFNPSVIRQMSCRASEENSDAGSRPWLGSRYRRASRLI